MAAQPTGAPREVENAVQETLLVVFVHGFKGTEQTFGNFPDRLQRILAETNLKAEYKVFPSYDTKGDLGKAVVRFADWLTNFTVEKEVASGGGAGKVKIVLCGHSMGGLLIADTLLEILNAQGNKDIPLWPNIVACIAFDTPFLGIHPYAIKNSVTKATEYASTVRTVGSTIFGAFAGAGTESSAETPQASPSTQSASTAGWGKWTLPAAYAAGSALSAGAAAWAAYNKREKLGTSFDWITDHLKYVSSLWNEASLKKRMNDMVNAEKQLQVTFRVFYTLIPAMPPFSEARMFVVLPKRASSEYAYFLPAKNNTAQDELQAHTGMFDAKKNDGYHELSLTTARIIQEALQVSKERNK